MILFARTLAPCTFMILLTGFVLTGCADRSVDDYRAEKMREKLAQLQPAEGAWRGSIEASNDGLSLGGMAMQILADTKVQNSSDNLGTEQQAFLRGSLHYRGLGNADLEFDHAGFTPNKDGTGEFKANFQVSGVDGKPITVAIQGTIAGNEFKGSLNVGGVTEYGANFTLYKDGAYPSSEKLQSGRAKKIESQTQLYAGKYPFKRGKDEGEDDATFAIHYLETKPEQQFLTMFQPIRQVVVEVNFGVASEDGEFRSLFNAFIDERAQTLKGNETTGPGTLNCRSTSANGVVTRWDCTIIGERNKVLNIPFTPAAVESPKTPKN